MKSSSTDKQLQQLFSKNAGYYKNKIKKLNRVFDFKHAVIIFGAAKLGRVFIEQCRQNQISILAVCDNDPDKVGTSLQELPIINPKLLKANYSPKVQIIVASLSDDKITKQLRRLGFKNIWSYSYFFSIFPDRFHSLALVSHFEEIFQNEDSIREVYSLLEDEYSKKVMLNTLYYRLTLNKTYLNSIEQKSTQTYFDPSIIQLGEDEVVVDGGAFDGDSLKLFIKACKGKYSRVFCFEPDTKSLELLKQAVKKMKLKKVDCLPYGLGEKNKEVGFTNEGNLQSSIKETGELKVTIVPIDDFINHKITFIKVDIEGYEKQTLLGAKRTIKNHKPKLAICAYHYQSDLWEIPLLIRKLNPGYKLFFRHYNPHLFETVCYGV